MPVLNPPSTSREIPPSNDEIRLRPTSHIAAILGGRMAESRHQGTEIADTLALMDDLGITDVELSLRQHVSREEILSLVMNRIKRDEIYDSESAQATRAFRALLPDLYGTFIPVRGWLAGEIIVVDRRQYQLTGQACRDCQTAPEASRSGGGVGCTDRINCGYWTCMGAWGYDHS